MAVFLLHGIVAQYVWDVIEHLPQPLDAMRSLYRALEPGGTLYLSLPGFLAARLSGHGDSMIVRGSRPSHPSTGSG